MLDLRNLVLECDALSLRLRFPKLANDAVGLMAWSLAFCLLFPYLQESAEVCWLVLGLSSGMTPYEAVPCAEVEPPSKGERDMNDRNRLMTFWLVTLLLISSPSSSSPSSYDLCLRSSEASESGWMSSPDSSS